MSQHSTVRQRVEYGLDTVPAERMVSVPLRDLLFVHQTLGEFVQFFHQPAHYPDLAAVHRFLGSVGTPGAFDALREAYYQHLHDTIPADIDEALGEGVRFQHPLSPDYFSQPNSNETGIA